MKILMAVDESKSVEDRLQAIVTRGRPETTEVLVLHVLHPIAPPPPQMDRSLVPELEGERVTARALVEQIAAGLRSAGFKAEGRVEVGDARESILDCASEWDADLIVVGSHQSNGIQRFLLGSVAEYVA